jgi:hypothetical protein
MNLVARSNMRYGVSSGAIGVKCIPVIKFTKTKTYVVLWSDLFRTKLFSNISETEYLQEIVNFIKIDLPVDFMITINPYTKHIKI